MAKVYTPDELANLIGKDKWDELAFATKEMNPDKVRTNLSNALGNHIAENYDLGIDSAIDKARKLEARPLLQRAAKDAYEEAPEINLNKIYETPIQKPVKLKIFNSPENDLGYMISDKKAPPLIHLNDAYTDKVNPRGVILHEGDHISDMLNKKFIPDDERKVISAIAGKGIDAAEQQFGKHHAGGFFELEALKRLMKNKKLLAAIPVLGKAAAVASVVDSGDIFAADPTGILPSDPVGEGTDEIPDQAAKDLYNARMKRTRKLLGEE